MAISLKATETGVATAEKALTNKHWNREDLAHQVVKRGYNTEHISIQTVQKFFTGKPVKKDIFVGICEALGLDWNEITSSTRDCDRDEYLQAIRTACQRVWVYQTWLPGSEIEANKICSSQALDIRLLLLSFKEFSPIYARLQGRRMRVEAAKHNSVSSVNPFVRNGRIDCVRFNYSHHPGWIAVIDSLVFWGPTPVDLDSHDDNVYFLFHKHSAISREGSFWVNQFELLWNQHSHTFDEEKVYNSELPDIT